MSCIKRKRKKLYLTDLNSICLNNNEITFKISDLIDNIYFCQILITDSFHISIQCDEPHFVTCESGVNEFQIEKNIRFTLIKSKNCSMIKIFYAPVKAKFYFENLAIFELKIMELNKRISLNTTFFAFGNFYGLAERASLSKLKRNMKYRLYNTDEFSYVINSDKPLYGSVPFVIGLFKIFKVGLLWENMSETFFKLTHKTGFIRGGRTIATFWSNNGRADMQCFLNEDVLQVRKMLMIKTGLTPLPPLFALGYHQCRWNYDDQNDILQVDAAMDKAGIPYDTIWLDIEHTDEKRYMTWDKSKFNPRETIAYLKEKDRHLVVIIDPHLKVDDDYLLYKEAKTNDFLIKDDDGSIFVGEGWSKDSSWVDFINEKACEWWSRKINDYLLNLNCLPTHNNLWIWNDMNEPSILNCPENQLKPTAKHVDNICHRDVHNIYGQKMAQSTWEGILNATNRNLRPFLLTRSFFTGSQKYGAIWTGDTSASWEYLQISVAMMNSLSTCGIDFSGSDVGGFFGDPDSELLTRWYQLGTLQPFFRAHSHIDSARREPYLIEDPYGSAIKNAISLRYRLLSYWYLCFWLADSHGDPVVSPIWMHDAKYRQYNVDYLFMIGMDILARPIVTRNCSKIRMTLPRSENYWYYFCEVSGIWKMYIGNHKIKIPISLKSIPIFYRAGSCIFMKDDYCCNTLNWQKLPYCVYIFPYPNSLSVGTLYIDDYCSFAYRDNKHYLLFRMTFDPSKKLLICEMEHVKLDTGSMMNSKIFKIIIIKNNYMSWSGYKSISTDGIFLEDSRITHFDDRIEITNLNLDVFVNCVLKFHS